VEEEEFHDGESPSTGFRVRCLVCERSTPFQATRKHAHDAWKENIDPQG
jgi:hypothetical protein